MHSYYFVSLPSPNIFIKPRTSQFFILRIIHNNYPRLPPLSTNKTFTGLEKNFAEHDPAVCEKQTQLDETRYPVKKMDGDVPGILEDQVWHVSVRQGLPVVKLSPDTEHHFRLGENLKTGNCSCLHTEQNVWEKGRFS